MEINVLGQLEINYFPSVRHVPSLDDGSNGDTRFNNTHSVNSNERPDIVVKELASDHRCAIIQTLIFTL